MAEMAKGTWTADNMPDLTGRIAVVTGANTGLGLETARALAAHGSSVVLAVRNLDKGRAAAADIAADAPDSHVSIQPLDLSSLASVHAAAGEIRRTHSTLDLLINNAGVMYTPRTTTEDGFELQFGVNHLGHFAFTGLLLDLMLPVESSRIVTVSSLGHRVRAHIDFDDLHFERNYSRAAAYGRSKLANLLFTNALQDALAHAGATTVALAAHPGGSRSELARNSPLYVKAIGLLLRPLVQSAAMGALPTLRAATDPTAVGGQYYGPGGLAEFGGYPVVVRSSDESRNPNMQRQLWEASEQLTGVTYPI